MNTKYPSHTQRHTHTPVMCVLQFDCSTHIRVHTSTAQMLCTPKYCMNLFTHPFTPLPFLLLQLGAASVPPSLQPVVSVSSRGGGVHPPTGPHFRLLLALQAVDGLGLFCSLPSVSGCRAVVLRLRLRLPWRTMTTDFRSVYRKTRLD